MVACPTSRKKDGAKNQIRNGSFSPLHVYFHLGTPIYFPSKL